MKFATSAGGTTMAMLRPGQVFRIVGDTSGRAFMVLSMQAAAGKRKAANLDDGNITEIGDSCSVLIMNGAFVEGLEQ